eukprot:CCRYP_016380-RA/>CCRYP_016380-RA protein AED:0.09 eAED:0.09 QI:166/1/1/1/1/1/5/193/454
MSSNSAAFPVLKNAMILQIMAELEIPLTESELVEPGRCRERVREVFSQLLCTCWGLTPAELSSLPTRTLARLSSTNESSPTSISTYPHLYADALVETKFFCLLQKLLKICGYDDFGFRDLSAPTGRRFRRQLSACINFMKYREDMNHLLSTVLEERADMFAALEEVAEEHMILQDHLKELREIHQEKLREKEEAEAECQEMEAEIAQQNKVQSSIRQENHLLQKSANELKDQIANLSIALRELQAEERQLNKEVVHSPGRIKEDVKKAEKDLEDIKALIEEKEHERNVMSRKIENMVQGEECVKAALEVMEDLDEKVQEYEVAVEDVEDMRRKVEEVESALEKKKALKEKREAEIRDLEARSLDSKTKLTKRLEAAKLELNLAVNKLGAVEEKRLDGIARVEASQKRVKEMEASIEAETKRTDKEILQRIASFREFEKVFMSKHKPLNEMVCGV